MEHPSLANSDRNTLETYCTLFELDWRGDKTIASQDKWLCTNPVYLEPTVDEPTGTVDKAEAIKMLNKAGVEYLGPLTKKMFELS